MTQITVSEVISIGGLFVATCLAAYALCLLAITRGALPDEVSERSSHKVATSRAGGFAFMLPVMVAACLALMLTGNAVSPGNWFLIGLSGLAALIGLADDKWRMSAVHKFLGQVLVATIAAVAVGQINVVPVPFIGDVSTSGPTGFVLTIIWIIAFINVFNFMDGLNGIAGACAVVALLIFAIAAASAGRVDAFVIAFCAVAGVTGFLVHNYAAGKIFMGDAGSHGLGFLIAALALSGSQDSGGRSIEFVFLPVVFFPFIFDVVVTLVRRLLKGEPLHKAHKQHIYQIMQQSGLSHARVSDIYAGLFVVSGVTALLLEHAPAAQKWLGPFMLGCFMGAATMVFFDKRANWAERSSGFSGDG